MAADRRKLALIATKGALDMAYPPFILASTAVALGYEVAVFFSFYGLQLLRKDLSHIRVSPIGNPAMPTPVPMPTLAAALPGMEGMATQMMKSQMDKKGIASLEELREVCRQGGARLIACDMTMNMFDLKHADFIDGVEIGGAATFLDFASDADIQLFV
jgi:peroxiredoxin family protein